MSKYPKRRHDRKELKLFASRLRRLRDELGISQDKLADDSGLSRSHIYYLESAKTEPGLLVLYDLAKVLKVDICDLVNDLEREEPFIPATKDKTRSKPVHDDTQP